MSYLDTAPFWKGAIYVIVVSLCCFTIVLTDMMLIRQKGRTFKMLPAGLGLLSIGGFMLVDTFGTVGSFLLSVLFAAAGWFTDWWLRGLYAERETDSVVRDMKTKDKVLHFFGMK